MDSAVSPSLRFPCALFGILMGFLLVGGCARSPDLRFVESEEASELSDTHRQSFSNALRRIYGTPAFPRIAAEDDTVDETDDEGVDEPDSEDSASEDEEAKSIALKEVVASGRLSHGAQVYNVRCAGCHGISGDGNGPAAPYLLPKPRDYRRGVYKFTSTPYGAKPARHDLVRTIRRGAKGTSMPAFPHMAKEDLEPLVDYVILLSERGEVERNMVQLAEFDFDEDEEIPLEEFLIEAEGVREGWQEAEQSVVVPTSAEPPYDEESKKRGRQTFITANCFKCHGADAKGQSEWLSPEFLAEQESKSEEERVKINYDAWGHPAPAADLTARMLHGGRRPLDIYRRIYTGINGTPMPAYGESYDSEKIWHLVHYVMHIVEGGAPTEWDEELGIDVAALAGDTENADEAETTPGAPEAVNENSEATPQENSEETPDPSAEDGASSSESDDTEAGAKAPEASEPKAEASKATESEETSRSG